jgi:hypothetical protein
LPLQHLLEGNIYISAMKSQEYFSYFTSCR